MMNAYSQTGSQSRRGAGHDRVLFSRPEARAGGAPNRLTSQFPAGPDAAAAARGALDGLDDRIDEERLGDLKLLVSELVTNSVRHADVRSDDTIALAVELGSDTVRIEVSDRGKGFIPRERDDDTSRPGGWGLYLVDRLADRWGVATGRA